MMGGGEKSNELGDGVEIGTQSYWDRIDRNMRREAASRALVGVLVECDPADRLIFLELLHEALRPGQPIVLIGGIMTQAQFWADMACRDELKAYCAVCYLNLPQADRTDFLKFARDKVAA